MRLTRCVDTRIAKLVKWLVAHTISLVLVCSVVTPSIDQPLCFGVDKCVIYIRMYSRLTVSENEIGHYAKVIQSQGITYTQYVSTFFNTANSEVLVTDRTYVLLRS